jgi:EAL domain-containing protein (putative c-di-GMP-specific phosphodiesterase class I)
MGKNEIEDETDGVSTNVKDDGSAPLAPQRLRLLVIDDEPSVVRGYCRILERNGARVEVACNGREAVDLAKASSFDVILSDISMPEMSGIEFLRALRQHDLDVPVILATGSPSVETAACAVELGAFRYLSKPVRERELWDAVLRAACAHEVARAKRVTLELPDGGRKRDGDRATLEVRFAWGMSLMWMAFQPIVGWKDRRVFGYEALLRSDEPLLRSPAELLDAAEKLGRLPDLGRAIRAKVAAASHSPECAGSKLFVNLHSSDLNDEELYSPDAPLSKIADRVVLEVTERASLEGVKDVGESVKRLKALGYQLAIDDLGAGYAGLTSFTQLEPSIVKLDMSLITGVDRDSRRQSIIRSMKQLCGDLGMTVVAEGVETAAERDALANLGCDLLQGYLFAKPQKLFPMPRW